MGLRLAVVAAALVASVSPAEFLSSRQLPSGAFAEPGGSGGPLLTAWAVLGLHAAGAGTGGALQYLVSHEAGLAEVTDVELVALAESAGGRRPVRLLARVRRAQRSDGRIGPNVNSTIWGILALRQAGERAPRPPVRFLLRRQARNGGWAWYVTGQPDSNDTAAAIQALRSAGVTGRPIRRGLAYLLRLRNADGGFELTQGRGSDAQSTAWAVQAFVAARRPPPRGAVAYLRGLRRADGSFRYSKRYVTTPVWVTAQVLPALAHKPFPLAADPDQPAHTQPGSGRTSRPAATSRSTSPSSRHGNQRGTSLSGATTAARTAATKRSPRSAVAERSGSSWSHRTSSLVCRCGRS